MHWWKCVKLLQLLYCNNNITRISLEYHYIHVHCIISKTNVIINYNAYITHYQSLNYILKVSNRQNIWTSKLWILKSLMKDLLYDLWDIEITHLSWLIINLALRVTFVIKCLYNLSGQRGKMSGKWPIARSTVLSVCWREEQYQNNF